MAARRGDSSNRLIPFSLPQKNGSGTRSRFLVSLPVCHDDRVELFHQLFHGLVVDQAGLLHSLVPGGGQPRQCIPMSMNAGAVSGAMSRISPTMVSLVMVAIMTSSILCFGEDSMPQKGIFPLFLFYQKGEPTHCGSSPFFVLFLPVLCCLRRPRRLPLPQRRGRR